MSTLNLLLTESAWRRRGWLIMLRLMLQEKERAGMSCESCNMGRDYPKGSIMRRQTSRVLAVDTVDEGDRGLLRHVVERLVGLKTEEVFRMVMSFL